MIFRSKFTTRGPAPSLWYHISLWFCQNYNIPNLWECFLKIFSKPVHNCQSWQSPIDKREVNIGNLYDHLLNTRPAAVFSIGRESVCMYPTGVCVYIAYDCMCLAVCVCKLLFTCSLCLSHFIHPTYHRSFIVLLTSRHVSLNSLQLGSVLAFLHCKPSLTIFMDR